MALFIDFSQRSLEWHIGQDSPFGALQPSQVIGIQADGDELELILKTFGAGYELRHIQDVNFTIPVPLGKRVVYWHGDIAKTIISNIL